MRRRGRRELGREEGNGVRVRRGEGRVDDGSRQMGADEWFDVQGEEHDAHDPPTTWVRFRLHEVVFGRIVISWRIAGRWVLLLAVILGGNHNPLSGVFLLPLHPTPISTAFVHSSDD